MFSYLNRDIIHGILHVLLSSTVSCMSLKCYWPNETCRKSKLTIVVPFRNPYVHLIQYRNNGVIIKMVDIKIVHKIVFGCVGNWQCITLHLLYLVSNRLSCTKVIFVLRHMKCSCDKLFFIISLEIDSHTLKYLR